MRDHPCRRAPPPAPSLWLLCRPALLLLLLPSLPSAAAYVLPPAADPSAHALFLHAVSLLSLGAPTGEDGAGRLVGHFMAQVNASAVGGGAAGPFFAVPAEEGVGGAGTIRPPADFGEVEHVGVLVGLHLAAVGGDMEAQMSLGYRYANGYGVQKNCNLALAYYEEAAHNAVDLMEHSELRGRVVPSLSRHRLSDIHRSGSVHRLSGHNRPHEQSDALDYFRHNVLAHQDVKSALTLAQMHYAGVRGVEQSMAQALEYFTFAADRGERMASGMAGTMYLLGMGTPRDEHKAQQYLMQGTPQGTTCTGNECDPTSLNGQGLMYLTGLNQLHPPLDQDIPMAMQLFEKAKNYGSFDAVYHIGMIRMGWMKDMVGGEVEEEGMEEEEGRRSKQSRFQKAHAELQSLQDQEQALSDLTKATKAGHLPAVHRLAIMKAHGIGTPRHCNQALNLFQQVSELGPLTAHRMREGYRHYRANRYEESLLHYLVAAESGLELAQSNAAFLLEGGTCLGLDERSCAAASLRLWKASAGQGNAEAYMKVGDFHFYGKLGGGGDGLDGVLAEAKQKMRGGARALNRVVRRQIGLRERQEKQEEQTCAAEEGEETGVCGAAAQAAQVLLENYDNAALYYRKAADQNLPHAMYNLGYMYEWGIGVKQDFPLAKRHYDMAAATNPEAAIPVQLALGAMRVHERVLKLWTTPAATPAAAAAAPDLPADTPAPRTRTAHERPRPRYRRRRTGGTNVGRMLLNARDLVADFLQWDVVLLLSILLSCMYILRRRLDINH